MKTFGHLLLPVLLVVCACAPVDEVAKPLPVVEVGTETEPAWHDVASVGDRQRIEDLDRAWSEAIAQIGQRRYGRILRDEGPLLDPGAALPRPAPPPGPYLCRTLKLGAQRPRGPAYAAYKPFFCYVEAEDDLLTFVKQTGSQRPAGRFYDDTGGRRLVFLGTLGLGDEAPLAYGENPDRDMAGVVERIGPFRYRLVIPFPRYESLLDVIELVPFVPSPSLSAAGDPLL